MVADLETSSVIVEKISPSDVPADAISTIRHSDCANILSEVLGRKIDVNRSSQRLNYGDIVYVAQFMGESLKKDALTSPHGAKIQFFKVTITPVFVPLEQ